MKPIYNCPFPPADLGRSEQAVPSMMPLPSSALYSTDIHKIAVIAMHQNYKLTLINTVYTPFKLVT